MSAPWTALLACPRCDAGIGEIVDKGCCPGCGQSFSVEGNVVRWPEPTPAPPQTSTAPRGLRDYVRSARYRLDPFASPYSPLAALTRRRTERYYQRTLADDRLARTWASHYLGGLALDPGAMVLDHGCGRGRVCAFLARLGHHVVGQDVAVQPWWHRLGDVGFAVLPPGGGALPWRWGSFDLVINSMVIGHLSPDALARHAADVHRRLKPGGVWLIAEANSLGFGTGMTRRYYGRLHALADVRRIASDTGYTEVDRWFEGVRSPVASQLVSYLRAHLSVHGFDVGDHGSWLERRLPPERRAMWVLRVRRP